MQTLEQLKNDLHFAEICDEAINHDEFVLTAEQYKETVEALLTDTLVGRQLYLWPPSLNPGFHTNSSFSYPHKGTIFVGSWGHFRVYEKDFSFLFKFPTVDNWNEISYASEFCILIN